MKKHILCLGDSNTHGYCPDPADCADGGIRFNEDERWTCRLQTALGPDYLVTEEGLSGRTTVFQDPLHETMDALTVIYSLLKSHEVVDLLIIMLGTNDSKERLGVNAACISIGMERLVRKAQSVDCWGTRRPNILNVGENPQHFVRGFGIKRACRFVRTEVLDHEILPLDALQNGRPRAVRPIITAASVGNAVANAGDIDHICISLVQIVCRNLNVFAVLACEIFVELVQRMVVGC